MTITPSKLPGDRYNPLKCSLTDEQLLRLQARAVERHVTPSTMLAIMVLEWFELDDATQRVADELEREWEAAAAERLAPDVQLTVDDPQVFDRRDPKRWTHPPVPPRPDGADAMHGGPANLLDGLKPDTQLRPR